MTRVAVLLALGIAIALVAVPRAQTLDEQLAMTREKLLQTYSSYKGYNLSPSDVYETKLDRDRRAVFDSVMRALFVEIEKEQPTGDRLIKHVTGVTGIWGARSGDADGKHMFRVSVRFDSKLADALVGATNIGASVKGHVMMPVASGGDDEPRFSKFDVRTQGIATYRQDGHPSVQVSFIKDKPETGEVDVDYHGWWDRCHDTPSNSDTASATGSHSHGEMFDLRYVFDHGLQLNWSSSRHCQGKY